MSQIYHQFFSTDKWRKCRASKYRILQEELYVKLNFLWNYVILNVSFMSKSTALSLVNWYFHQHSILSPLSQSVSMFNSILLQGVSMLQYIRYKGSHYAMMMISEVQSCCIYVGNIFFKKWVSLFLRISVFTVQNNQVLFSFVA